jgi:hypothetical protein
MTERYSRGTAYHEAGHAVVAWSLSLPLGDIGVRADDASGWAQIAGAKGLPLVEQIAVLFGGWAAEVVFGHPTHERAGSRDLEEIMYLLRDHGISEENGDGLALRREGRACARTRLEAHKDKVIALAEHLVEHGRVEADEVLRLITSA